MTKGYSREIMEELFKEEQKKQEKEKAIEAARLQKQKQQTEAFKIELLFSQLQKAEDEIQRLNKRVARMRNWVIFAVIVALIAAAFGLSSSLTDLIYTLP